MKQDTGATVENFVEVSHDPGLSQRVEKTMRKLEDVLPALRNGDRIARKEWPKEAFIYMRRGNSPYDPESGHTGVAAMANELFLKGEPNTTKRFPYIVKCRDGYSIPGAFFDAEDILSEDWEVLPRT